MLLGALPPVANAKDDGYVLYSEDGVEMKKMKREFFTADVERVGCDYWKEGSGDDKQNLSGAYEPYDERIYRGYTSDVDHTNPIDPTVSGGGSGSSFSGIAANTQKNYYIYNATKVKKYCHYGDYWLCFKLKDGESENGGDYFVCGDRAKVNPTYYINPGQAGAPISEVSKIDGYPIAIFNHHNRIQFIQQTSNSAASVTGFGLHYGTKSHFYTDFNPLDIYTTATYNRNYGYGLRGVKQQGSIYSASINYGNAISPIGSILTYKETPIITHTDTYTYKFDDEVHRLCDENYYTDVDIDASEIPLITPIISWSNLYNLQYNNLNDLEHCMWKLGVGDTIIAPPTQITPSFYRILPVANRKDHGDDTITFPSLNAPRGVLRSIAVIGVESYSSPIYDGYHIDYYDHGKSNNFYMPVEDYYSYVGYVFYWKSRAMYAMRNAIASVNMIASNESYYYINDMVSNFINNNYIALSRKGIQISICKRLFSSKDNNYIDYPRCMNMIIGANNFMDSDDISDVDIGHDWYNTNYNYGHEDHSTITGIGSDEQYITDNLYFDINKYGDGTLTTGTVRVDTTLIDHSVWPSNNADYVYSAGMGWRFKNKYTATDDYIFDTNHTLNVIRNIPNPETGAAYDEYSLRTLWKMDININGVTRYSLDTTFPNARPQVMKLDFNPNTSTNYGFGNEFSIDTTNNKVSRLGVRVDSNKVRRAGTQTIRGNCLIMRDNTGAYQSIRLTGSGSWANQGNTSAKFRPENIYYCTRAVEAGTTISDDVNAYVSPLYSSHKHIYYSDVSGWSTPYTYYSGKPLYLVGTIDSDGWFSVVSMMYDNRARRYGYMTQDLPTSDDGLYYIYLGHFVYDGGTYSYFELEENHPIYYYKYGRINEYRYRPQDLNDFVIYETPQSTPVSVVTNRGEVDLRFGSAFNNTWDDTTGMLTIGYLKRALPKLPLTPLIINEETAVTNIAPSSYVKACDVEELLIDSTDYTTAYYIDFNVIFRTTDGTPMTDGTFEAMLSWSANPNYGQDWVDGTAGEPLGYFKAKRVYAPNENEIVLKMKGYFKRSAYRGAQYPYIVVKHTCSTNMDVGYSITGYQTAYPTSS